MKVMGFGQYIHVLFFIFIIFISNCAIGSTDVRNEICIIDSMNNTVILNESEIVINTSNSELRKTQQPNIIVKKIIDKVKRRKKIIAAVLAFPVPFGIIGLHRIYLGTKPYVPLIYIGTLGGALGILPLIDFISILVEKDLARFEKNDKVFMWVK